MSPRNAKPRIVWLVDWRDSEDAGFADAFSEIGDAPRVIRSRPTGPTVGTRRHRFYSYPAYVSLATRGLAARPDVLVTWQPLVAALLALVPFRPPIVAIEPVLVENDRRLMGRFTQWALKRVECVVCCSEGVAERFAKMGFSQDRLAVVDRGVVLQAVRQGPGDDYLLAGGREHRDWVTLREAAASVDLPVRLGAPNPPADHGKLEVLPVLSHAEYLEQLRSARALVIPLKDGSRAAGLHALLEALAHGVPVIASHNMATTDYITDGTGILVDAGDVDELRDAMKRISDPEFAASASAAATELVRKRYSLTRFVQRVHDLALQLR